jgi:single-strand DNA-binding protein
MSRGLNKVQLLGFMGKDPEVMMTQGGTIIASISLATSERRKEGGDWVDATEWHSLKLFNRMAEVARDYCRKGTQLFIEGKIQTRSWDDRDTGEKKYRTEIIVNELILLGSPATTERPATMNGGGQSYAQPQHQPPPPPPPRQPQPDPIYAGTEITDDDIPF